MHGISGNTLHEGKKCDKQHPKMCRRFMRNHIHRKYGCNRGEACTRYHPQHCKSSLSSRTCFSKECRLVHIAGTIRDPAKSNNSRINYNSRTNFNNRANNGGNMIQNHQQPRHQQNNSDHRDRNQRDSQNAPCESAPPAQAQTDFLELRILLTTFQDTIQKEMVGLKTQISAQEQKLASFIPPMNQQISHQMMPPNVPSQTLLPRFQNQPPMSWQHIPVSGY